MPIYICTHITQEATQPSSKVFATLLAHTLTHSVCFSVHKCETQKERKQEKLLEQRSRSSCCAQHNLLHFQVNKTNEFFVYRPWINVDLT